jgi:hypothetical protein
VAYFGESGKMDSPFPGRNSNRTPPKYESEAPPCHYTCSMCHVLHTDTMHAETCPDLLHLRADMLSSPSQQ